VVPAHIPTMAHQHSKGTRNPSESSLQWWDNEGGAIKGVRAKRPRDAKQLGKLKASHGPGRKRKAMAGRKNT
jgi:hypothetical protein